MLIPCHLPQFQAGEVADILGDTRGSVKCIRSRRKQHRVSHPPMLVLFCRRGGGIAVLPPPSEAQDCKGVHPGFGHSQTRGEAGERGRVTVPGTPCPVPPRDCGAGWARSGTRAPTAPAPWEPGSGEAAATPGGKVQHPTMAGSRLGTLDRTARPKPPQSFKARGSGVRVGALAPTGPCWPEPHKCPTGTQEWLRGDGEQDGEC